MEARELRISNWVYHKTHKQNVQVNANTLLAIENGSTSHSPIPLTADILEKSGAIRKYESVYFIRKLKFEISHSQLCYFCYSGKSACILYVHHLQNLVFALTSQELNIQF